MKVLILGAHGHIARLTESMLTEAGIPQRLFLRNSHRLQPTSDLQEVLTGDASNYQDLYAAMDDVDLVYANLAGDNIESQAENVVKAMEDRHLTRLIWISTLGIYDEVPGAFGKWNHQMLDGGYLETYAAAAKIIENSQLEYTIIRPAWLTNKDEIDYELTEKGDSFKGTEVSRKSIAALVTALIKDPDQHIRASLGVDKPGTDGAKPAWY